MKDSTAGRRLALWRAAGSIAAVAITSLGVATAANAAVITVTPDNGGTADNLGNAIKTANTNGGSNTLILQPGTYNPQELVSPGYGLPPITSKITIVVPHADVAPSGGNTATINATAADGTPGNFIQVNSGGSLTLEGVAIQQPNSNNDSSHNGIEVESGGSLAMYGVYFVGEGGNAAVAVDNGGTANIVDSTFDSSVGANAILNSGTTTLTNDTVAFSSGIGIDNNNGASLTVNNTVAFANTAADCHGTTTTQDATTASDIDDDGSCTTSVWSDNPAVGTESPGTYGGPTTLYQLQGSPTALAGSSAQCPTVDQRFYVNPVNAMGVRSCDVGSYTDSATQQTTAPTCTALAPVYPSGGPATETVNVLDSKSGLGPEPGTQLDSTTGSSATTNVPATTGNISPADAVSNLFINNGSTALLNPFLSPTAGTNLQIEATKTTQGSSTTWSFDATNWAGITSYCH